MGKREGGRPHAIVIGASMTGMLAARVLADHARVTLVERDPLSSDPDPRRGTPQAHHLHALLARGMTLIENWFPGLRDELVKAGAVAVDNGTELGYLGPFGWSPGHERGLIETLWATRSFIDVRLRDRLKQDDRVAWMTETRIAGLALDAAQRRVTGVRTEDGRTLDADLVVDATGRGSALPAWLREHGLPAPRESVVDAGTRYASALVRFRRPIPKGWKVVFLLAAPPKALCGGVMSLVEGGRALVTFIGLAGLELPSDRESCLAFARGLRSPVLADLLEDAEWLTPVRSTRTTANLRRHYEEVAMPAGVFAMGDAICAFNPIYGQGMTVAAMQADALAALLARVKLGNGDASLPSRAHAAFANVVRFPWTAATGEDFRLETTQGKRTPGLRVMHAYIDRVFVAAAERPDVMLKLVRVFNLLASPLSLYSPGVVWAALQQTRPQPVFGPVPVP